MPKTPGLGISREVTIPEARGTRERRGYQSLEETECCRAGPWGKGGDGERVVMFCQAPQPQTPKEGRELLLFTSFYEIAFSLNKLSKGSPRAQEPYGVPFITSILETSKPGVTMTLLR